MIFDDDGAIMMFDDEGVIMFDDAVRI